VNRQQLKWQIPVCLLALALVGALVWWVLGYRFTEQTRTGWQQTLRGAGLADKVQWQALHASPSGAVTVRQLRIELPSRMTLHAEELRFSDLINQPGRQRIRMSVKQARADFSDMPIHGYADYAVTTAFNPAPVDVNLLIDVDFARDRASIAYDKQLPGFVDMALQLDLSQVAGLRGVAENLLPSVATAVATGRNPSAIAAAIAQATQPDLLAAAPSMRLDALQASITNRGIVQKVTAALKSSVIMDLVDARTPFTLKEADAAFAEKVKGFQARCHSEFSFPEPTCQHLADVALDKKQGLSLTARPPEPVSLARLMAQFAGTKNVLSVLELLNIDVQ